MIDSYATLQVHNDTAERYDNPVPKGQQHVEYAEEEIEPIGDPNAEYCWVDEPDHNGGWFCHHPDCVTSPYADEQELQALERLDMFLDGDREVGEDDFSDLEEGPDALTELEESHEAYRQMARDESIFLGGPDV